MYQYICKKCGKEFKSYKKTASFCSVSCRVSFQHENFLLESKKLIGQKFDRLKVIDIKIENHKTKCLCLCKCGNKIWVDSYRLKNGHTKSCGCYQKEIAQNNNQHYLDDYRQKNIVENTHVGKISQTIQKNNKSGIVGVYLSSNNKWIAKLEFQKHTYKKQFNTIEEAIKYRKELEEKYFKPILEKRKKIELYEKSLSLLKQQDKKISKNNWNKIAKENNLLSARSIEYISQEKFKEILNAD